MEKTTNEQSNTEINWLVNERVRRIGGYTLLAARTLIDESEFVEAYTREYGINRLQLAKKMFVELVDYCQYRQRMSVIHSDYPGALFAPH